MSEFRTTKEWPYAVSCGGAVYKIVDDQRYYAVLFRGESFGKYGNSWHLPKGHLDESETLQQGARREIAEESGLEVEFRHYLGALHSVFFHEKLHMQNDKIIHYFLCEYKNELQKMDSEHDQVEWLTADEAIINLGKSPKNEEEIIERAEKAFALINIS